MFETEAITTLMGFIRQFREMERARRPLFAYRLTGKVKLQDHSLPLPFEVRGPMEEGSRKLRDSTHGAGRQDRRRRGDDPRCHHALA
jgi:hypothetical protein